jgi:hypothetical protein
LLGMTIKDNTLYPLYLLSSIDDMDY